MVIDNGHTPLVTILLPTHNRADVLPFAIRSALQQTLTDFELIIVGDGCTDDTAAVVKRFNDPRIRWLDLPKSPHFGYANRNVGLRQSRGRYIAYLAHDDLWLHDHLEIMIDALEQHNAEFAYSRGISVERNGAAWPYVANLHDPRCYRKFVGGGRVTIGMTMVVHLRSCLERYGYWNENLPKGGDHELWRRTLRAGKGQNFIFVPKPTTVRFVADWRPNDHGLHKWTRNITINPFRMAEHLLPPALRLDLSTAQTEQEATWRKMETDPACYATEIRRAVIQYHDTLLWQFSGPIAILFALTGKKLQNVAVRLLK